MQCAAKVEKDFGSVPKWAMASGGNEQAVASLSHLVDHTVQSNHAILQHGMHAQAFQHQELMRGLLAAVNPEALAKFNETAKLQMPAPLPPPAPFVLPETQAQQAKPPAKSVVEVDEEDDDIPDEDEEEEEEEEDYE